MLNIQTSSARSRPPRPTAIARSTAISCWYLVGRPGENQISPRRRCRRDHLVHCPLALQVRFVILNPFSSAKRPSYLKSSSSLSRQGPPCLGASGGSSESSRVFTLSSERAGHSERISSGFSGACAQRRHSSTSKSPQAMCFRSQEGKAREPAYSPAQVFSPGGYECAGFAEGRLWKGGRTSHHRLSHHGALTTGALTIRRTHHSALSPLGVFTTRRSHHRLFHH